ncbi:MAG TPA: hemolysin family protein, partial [Acidimicrobiales bacterium]|nr:hemolysin family protein [Acidimicrobiales bacterium]
MLAIARFSGSDAVLVVVIVALLAGAAVLALAETGLVRMTTAKARSMQEAGHRSAKLVLRLIERPESFLNPILLMVLVCQLVAATLVGVLSEHLFGALGVALATVFEVVVIFVLAEAVPKNWAVKHPDRAALLAAPLVGGLLRFPPVRWLSAALIGLSNLILPGSRGRTVYVTESELLALADMAVEEAVIETEERAFIHSILEFGDTVVREVMVPRPDMVAAHATDRVDEVLELAIATGHSRIPVYGDSIDDIVGLVFAKDLMRAALEGASREPVDSLVRPAHVVPETKKVSELLREMQAGQFHMAIVVDEYGGTAGLVTLEDLIEELVGEIVDEDQAEEPMYERLASGDLSVSGKLPVDEANELLDARLPEGDWDTVGGLFLSLLGHVPQEGETAEVDGHLLRAERVEGNRIARVRISRLSPP